MQLKEYLTQLQESLDALLFEANRMHALAADELETNYWEGMRTAYSKLAVEIQTELAKQ